MSGYFRRCNLPVLLLAGVFLALAGCRHEPGPPAANIPAAQERPASRKSGAEIPVYVLETLIYVKQNDRAPDGFVGGRSFQNRERRLPQRSAENQAIRYREWDVLPKIPGRNRGPERLVTGSDQTAWYTRDHYKSFQRIE